MLGDLEESRARVRVRLDQEKTLLFWQWGRRIHRYEMRGTDRAKYGAQLIPKIAERIGYSDTVVKRMRVCSRFYRTEREIRRISAELRWSHIDNLLCVNEKRQRDLLTKQAIRNQWTVPQLRGQIRKLQVPLIGVGDEGASAKGSKKAKKFGPLKPRRGKLYTYQLELVTSVHTREPELRVDAGFKHREKVPLNGLSEPKAGQIVESARREIPGRGFEYTFRLDAHSKKRRYSYKALVLHVTDADTQTLDIDLGFGGNLEEKIRLKGIDAKEKGTTLGDEATEFVRTALSRVPFVVISTYYEGKFGRTLVDLFYNEGTNDAAEVLRTGTCLNQQLLDLGYAVRM